VGCAPGRFKEATRTGQILQSGASGVAAAVGPNIAAEEDLTKELVDFARDVLD